MFEQDRAIALGEQARDIVDLIRELGDQAQLREELASLPGPVPRPIIPGQAATPIREAVVRPTAGIAYTAERTIETDPVPGQALVDRIAAELDPRGVLAA